MISWVLQAYHCTFLYSGRLFSWRPYWTCKTHRMYRTVVCKTAYCSIHCIIILSDPETSLSYFKWMTKGSSSFGYTWVALQIHCHCCSLLGLIPLYLDIYTLRCFDTPPHTQIWQPPNHPPQFNHYVWHDHWETSWCTMCELQGCNPCAGKHSSCKSPTRLGIRLKKTWL